jgi:hypothetical protein
MNPLPKDSEQHRKVLEYVKARLRLSEFAMNKFYNRWTANERRAQAYVTLADYEALLKEQNQAGGAPQVVTITIPHSYATTATMVTYWLHTFAGRSPMFPVRGPYTVHQMALPLVARCGSVWGRDHAIGICHEERDADSDEKSAKPNRVFRTAYRITTLQGP